MEEVKETGEVVSRDLVLPIRKDSYGKAYVRLSSTFPEDFISVEYGAPVLFLGAFGVKFVGANYPVEDLAEELVELVNKDVEIFVRFKSLKLRRGLKEISLVNIIPEGRSGATVKTGIIFPLNSSGFGEVTGKFQDGSVFLPEGKMVFDFEVPVKNGDVVLSYGISKLTLKELDSKEEFNLLAVF